MLKIDMVIYILITICNMRDDTNISCVCPLSDSLELDARQWSFSFHMSQSTWQANVVLTSITPIYNQVFSKNIFVLLLLHFTI